MSAPRRYPGWGSRLASGLTFATLLAAPLAAQARPARVAVVLDRASSRFQPQLDAFQREVLGFFRPGELTLLPAVAGDGTPAGIGRVLERALHDSTISVVVTLGPIGSHLLARGGEPAKPAIAGIIIRLPDANSQRLNKRRSCFG